MDITINMKRSDFHHVDSMEKVATIYLTRHDFRVRDPKPVDQQQFAVEVSSNIRVTRSRTIAVSQVPKTIKLVDATIQSPVSEPQVIVMIASIKLIESVINNIIIRINNINSFCRI